MARRAQLCERSERADNKLDNRHDDYLDNELVVLNAKRASSQERLVAILSSQLDCISFVCEAPCFNLPDVVWPAVAKFTKLYSCQSIAP